MSGRVGGSLRQRGGRRNAERRTITGPRHDSRIAGNQRHTATPLSVPPRRLLRPWDLTSGHRRETSSLIQAGYPALRRHPSSHLRRGPVVGPDGYPRPRVRACEAWPRARHPTGSGYPSPAKLSLCPTSVTPLEAPLIGQDASRISEVLGTGIRNCKIFFRLHLQARALATHVVPANAGTHNHRC